MAKFKDMNLNINKSLKVIKVGKGGIDVAVKQYLPAVDKNAILEIAMQQADQGTILNTFMLDAIFHTYLVIKYTDIQFDEYDKEDIMALYDVLESQGIISAVIAAIPKEEYEPLRNYLLEMVDSYLTYRNSARALVEQFAFFAPTAAEKLKEVTENFDTEKLKQVVQIADKTGMNNGQV